MYGPHPIVNRCAVTLESANRSQYADVLVVFSFVNEYFKSHKSVF